MSEDVVLFLANADGSVDCAWCGENFDAELAEPDSNDDPICPECVASAIEEGSFEIQEDHVN